ncbi:histidinol-phosphatase HisJ family protein [Enterococcus alishanensis]|uniref:Histidinol-phosphatase n=1 Tax=Enterococcus alishanensis TaxID=1303817 RepID=A0ABS6T7R5_9ENTE|nr:histidinol-phosphatase HisJ family protein [Enterococcus alishanensis]MBV7389193.1 histidinol-phosphatase HisJ family protein [Enterococcus alishanensis]
MFISNAHTHCTWCDGKNTLTEMAQAAIDLGFTDLGFTSHSYAPFDPSCLGVEDEFGYQKAIAEVQDKFAGQIQLSTGIEQDYYSPAILQNYDYTIGSVHYFPPQDGIFRSVDESPESLAETLQTFYQGDAYKMIQDFYNNVVKHISKNQNKIVGHFDLITKFNEKNPWFDATSEEYQKIASTALNQVIDVIQTYDGLVEVNTGAISRNWRSGPYPQDFLMKILLDRKVPIIITSDSHATDTLTCFFPETKQILADIGFKESYQLKDGIFQPIAF